MDNKASYRFCPLRHIITHSSLKRDGFTLTEMAVVLGIVSIILAAIWSALSRANDSNKTQKAEGEVLAIVNGYKSLWAQRGIDTTGVGYIDVTCVGIHNGIFPSEMIQPGTVCTGTPPSPNLNPLSPWGTPVAIGVSLASGTLAATGLVYIAYTGLSPSACIKVASAIYVPPVVAYQAINDGTTTGGNLGNGWSANLIPPGIPWTLDQITGFCTGGVQGPNKIAQIGFYP